MTSIVVEKPYKFVPPHRGDLWPTLIQRLRLYESHLRKKEGVCSHEIRHAELLKRSLDARHGIVLTPNHCRYADPLVLGWLAKAVDTHVFAMASWHLFNMGWFNKFSIQKMGGFSVYREGLDKQSIETAIAAVTDATRPLILFAEGATFRSNDRLQPLLDGASFIARTAARRRAKNCGGRVVVHPIAIKYVFQGDVQTWANDALRSLEQHLDWVPNRNLPILNRIERIIQAMLVSREIEYFGKAFDGDIRQRSVLLTQGILNQLETRWEVAGDSAVTAINRIRTLRGKMLKALLDIGTSEATKESIREELQRLQVAQHLASFPVDYLTDPPVTETRVLETLETLQESMLGESSWPGPLKAIIEVSEAIDVPPARSGKGDHDPLLQDIADRLTERLGQLQTESRAFEQTSR